jgi:predicted metal-dependent peptidase
MSSEFVKILGYLLDIGSEINLVQCDTKIHEFKKITKNSQIKNIKIKGLGGTILQPGIDYFKDNKMGQYPLAILTDGYTDTLNLSGFPKTIILYTEKECPTISNVEQYYVGKNKY